MLQTELMQGRRQTLNPSTSTQSNIVLSQGGGTAITGDLCFSYGFSRKLIPMFCTACTISYGKNFTGIKNNKFYWRWWIKKGIEEIKI